MIWLTGGCLALSLAMVILLLLFVFSRGISTFWPGPISQVHLLDGSRYLGEETEDEDYDLAPEVYKDLPAAIRDSFHPDFSSGDGVQAHRRLLRVGNFELSNTHYRWLSEFAVASRTEPRWALVLERVKDGRFYGQPEALLELEPWDASKHQVEQILARDANATVLVSRAHGYAQERVRLADLSPADQPTHLVVASKDGPEAAWQSYMELHEPVRKRVEQAHSLENNELGDLNRLSNEARLGVVEARLKHGENAPEVVQAQARFEHVRGETDQKSATLLAQIAEIRSRNRRYSLLVRAADGQCKAIPLAGIVRAYPANQLGLGGKLRVYASRWWEFLSSEPRNANSEGGVLPAIFGTVALTLIMCLLVVPFGVLAALYLREYARPGFIVSMVRISVNNLAGVPSIVFGVFGLGFFCYGIGKYVDGGPLRGLQLEPWSSSLWFGLLSLLVLVVAGATYLSLASAAASSNRLRRRQVILSRVGLLLWLSAATLALLLAARTPFFHGFFTADLEEGRPTFGTGGILWASMTLALLTLPVVIVATEEALAAVPNSLREGSYACGASKWQTIRRIVLPHAMPGIMTGMILAMARGAGEVAPLMLVGAMKMVPALPIDGRFPFVHGSRSFMHLGFHIYDVGFQSQDSQAAKPMVFTTTLLLMGIIAILNIAAIWLRIRLKRRFVKGHF